MGLLASLFVKIGADTKELQKGLTGAKQGLGDVTKSVLQSAVGFASFGGAVLAAGKFLKDSINDTVAYAEEVRQLSRTIGSTPEDASKLIQAADDVKISFGTMQTAMNIAIRNGLEPTIDGMGRLADEYVAIQDPIARSKFLLDTFGRSGGEMAALMELGAEGIRELGDAAEETGMVLDQEALDKTRNFEKAIDNLQDTFMGLKISVAEYALPALVEFIGEIDTYAQRSMVEANNRKKINELYKSGAMSAKDATAAKVLNNQAFREGAKDQELSLYLLKKLESELNVSERQLRVLTVQNSKWISSLDSGTRSMILNGLASEGANNAITGFGGALEELLKMEPPDKGANYLKALTIQLDYNAEAMGRLKGAMDNEFFNAQEDFAESQQDIKTKMEGVNAEIQTALSQGYSEQGTKVQGLRTDYQELATQYATNATEHEKMKKQIMFDLLDQKMAVDGYTTEEKEYLNELALSWGLVTQAELDFEDAMADWATLITNPMALTKEELQGILDNIDMLPPETVLTIKTILEGEDAVYNLIEALNGTYTMDIVTGFGLPIEPGKAAGGPVYYGNAYPVGERGPELFVPSQSGYIVPNHELEQAAATDNSQMIRLLQQIASSKAIDESRLARVIRDAMLQVVG